MKKRTEWINAHSGLPKYGGGYANAKKTPCDICGKKVLSFYYLSTLNTDNPEGVFEYWDTGDVRYCESCKAKGDKMSITKECCGVCNKFGNYDHDNDENGEMTLLSHIFDYVHWDCFDKAMELRDKYDNRRREK